MKRILLYIFLLLFMYTSFLIAQDDRNSGSKAKETNTEPTVNGKPYSQWKAEQEELKRKQLEEEHKANVNNPGPSVISSTIDPATGKVIPTDNSQFGNSGQFNQNYTPVSGLNSNSDANYVHSTYNAYQNDAYRTAFIRSFGDFAAYRNSGFLVNAIGLYAAYENSGYEVNVIGTYAGFCNTHNYINIIGVYKADAPQDEATVLTGDLFLRDPYESGGNITGNSIYFNSSKTARVWYDKSAGEIKVTDNSGNSTTISPHNFSLLQPSEDMAWSFYSVNEEKGKQVNVDMMKVVRLLEQLTGEKLVYIADLKGNELDEQIQKVTSLTDRISKLEGENKELKVLLNHLIEEMKKEKK